MGFLKLIKDNAVLVISLIIMFSLGFSIYQGRVYIEDQNKQITNLTEISTKLETQLSDLQTANKSLVGLMERVNTGLEQYNKKVVSNASKASTLQSAVSKDKLVKESGGDVARAASMLNKSFNQFMGDVNAETAN